MTHPRSCKSELASEHTNPHSPCEALITSPHCNLFQLALLHPIRFQCSSHRALGASLGSGRMAADNTDFRGKDFQSLILNSSSLISLQ